MREDAEKLINQFKIFLNDLKEISFKERDEKTKQLEEVQKAIANLEKATISIPAELRNLKSKLEIQLEKMKGSNELFDFLTSELKEILDTISELKTSLKTPKPTKFPKVVFEDDVAGMRPSVRAGRRE